MRYNRALALAFGMAASTMLQQVVVAADKVNLAATTNTGDIGIFYAIDKGFLRDEGIEANLISFDTGAKMVPALATGELDIGTIPGSAGIYNAAARAINNRIVADRSRSAPDDMYQTLMIRKDLIDSGRFKTYSDLKGLKVAVAAPGISILSIVNQAAKKGGIAYNDIEKVFIPLPQQVAAFRNKAVEASIMIEPFATLIVANGEGVRFASTYDFNPDGQFTYMVYSEKFSKERPDVARRFMKAYIRALRAFNDATEKGRWKDTPHTAELIDILAKRLDMPAPRIRATFPHAVDPDGRVNIKGMQIELDFFKEQKMVQSPTIKVEDVVDLRFVEMALKDLGPYQRKP
jgi:NitT/TauT family transport system substrate-binding protein